MGQWHCSNRSTIILRLTYLFVVWIVGGYYSSVLVYLEYQFLMNLELTSAKALASP